MVLTDDSGNCLKKTILTVKNVNFFLLHNPVSDLTELLCQFNEIAMTSQSITKGSRNLSMITLKTHINWEL